MVRNSNESNTEEKAPLLPTRNSENEFNGSSFGGAVFNLSTTMVGAGIMSLPAAMKVLGVVPGAFMIIFVALLSESSIDMLIRFSRAANKISFGGIMGDAFGNFGKMLLQICIVVNNIGVEVVYLIVIGDVLSGTTSNGVHHSGVLEEWFGMHWWNGRFFVLLITTLLIFTPLTSFKRIDSLRFTSALSVGLAVVFVVITAVVAIVRWFNGTVSMPRLFPKTTDVSSFFNLFTAFPVLVNAYSCNFNVHSINNVLEDSSQIKPISQTSVALCCIVYMATSFFCFLLFGESTLQDVLANYDTDLGIPCSYLISDMVRVCYVLHLVLVFPMIFHALRLNLHSLIFPTKEPLPFDNVRFASITIALLSVVFLAANFIPSIWDAFQIMGATTAVCIGFIFPAAITLRDSHGIASRRDRVLSAFMIFVAVVTKCSSCIQRFCCSFRQEQSNSSILSVVHLCVCLK